MRNHHIFSCLIAILCTLCPPTGSEEVIGQTKDPVVKCDTNADCNYHLPKCAGSGTCLGTNKCKFYPASNCACYEGEPPPDPEKPCTIPADPEKPFTIPEAKQECVIQTSPTLSSKWECRCKEASQGCFEDGKTAWRCEAGKVITESCKKGDKCIQGKCRQCEPLSRICPDGEVAIRVCSPEGFWESHILCPINEECSFGVCAPVNCTPGTSRCLSDKWYEQCIELPNHKRMRLTLTCSGICLEGRCEHPPIEWNPPWDHP